MALAAAWGLSGTAAAADAPGGFHLSGGWTARFFVAPVTREPASAFETSPHRNTLGVNARLSRPLGKRADVALEATNLFDREPPASQGLLPPASGRGLRLSLRKAF